MCNRRARYKVRARISEFFRKIIRTYRQRAGCLVTKKDAAGNLSILLIQGMNKRKNSHLVYKMPAGNIERGETRDFAAIRETVADILNKNELIVFLIACQEEESGAKGVAAEYIGEYRCNKNMSQSYFYLLDDSFTLLPPDEYEEGLVGRDRKWFTEIDALNMVPKEQKDILLKGLAIYKKKHNLI